MKKKLASIILAISLYICGFSQQLDSIIDLRDGQQYRIVKIDEQWWMAQNLNFYTSSGSAYYNNDSVQNWQTV